MVHPQCMALRPLHSRTPPSLDSRAQEDVQLDIKSFDMGVLFLPSKIPPKRPLPMDYDSDDSDDQAAAAGGSDSSNGAGAAADAAPAPFSCDPDGALYRLRPLSYRCPEPAPKPRLKTLPLGLLPIPQQLPGEAEKR